MKGFLENLHFLFGDFDSDPTFRQKFQKLCTVFLCLFLVITKIFFFSSTLFLEWCTQVCELVHLPKHSPACTPTYLLEPQTSGSFLPSLSWHPNSSLLYSWPYRRKAKGSRQRRIGFQYFPKNSDRLIWYRTRKEPFWTNIRLTKIWNILNHLRKE